MKSPRIAWLLTSAFYYWHPMLSCLTDLFPETVAFAANWRGYAPGFDNSFTVEVVGERKVIALAKSETSYGSNFTYMPLNIVKQLFRFKPDVVFSNSFGVWTVLALLFKPLGNWRVVIAYEGSSPGVDYRNSSLRLAIRQLMVNAADACITNSQAGKNYLIEWLKAPEEKVFLHPYEVPSALPWAEITTVATPKNNRLQQHPIFLFVGSITPRKGLHLLLKACALLKQKGDRFTLNIVGGGSQQQELELFCRQHELTECVQWIGQVDYKVLGHYFHQADVFVLPTLEDTWGMVILEAMAVGKAMLCSKFAGASELIEDGENGYRFDPNEPEKLATLMHCFIDDLSLSAVMGGKAKQTMTHYTPEMAANFLGQVTFFVLENSPGTKKKDFPI